VRNRHFSVSRRQVMAAVTALPMAAATALPFLAWARESTSADAEADAAARRRGAKDVLNVRDFELLAQQALPPAHFGYLATGIDDDRTLKRNEEAYGNYEIRARRFVDLTQLNTGLSVFGTRWPLPIYLSAVSSMRAFHPDGEAAVGRAAASRSVQMMLSSGSSVSLERAEKAGADAIVLSVDTTVTHEVRNSETLKRASRVDTRPCITCHKENRHDMWLKAPLFANLDVSRVHELTPPNMTLPWLRRLRDRVRGKLMVKGIVTGEDASLAMEQGVDAIIISNHGGRNEETLRATIDCVPEVVAAVKRKVPVFVDGGIRRGTDIFKALALGVTAVGIGRPQGWGLAAFGQEGVEAVLDIYSRELQAIMRQAGTPRLADIESRTVIHRRT